MLRVKRISAAELSESSRSLCTRLNAWNAELRAHVSPAAAALLPEVDIDPDGKWVNFKTQRRGEFSESVRSEALSDPAVRREFESQSAEIRTYLSHEGPLDDASLESTRTELLELLERGGHFCLFEHRSALLLPYETVAEERARAAAIPPQAAAATAAAAPVKKRGCLIPLLLGLLLPLLLLLLLWWFVLYPWPFSGTLREALDDFLNRSGISAWVDDGQAERQQAQIDELQQKLDEAEKQRLADEETARLKAEEEQRKLDEALAQKQAAEEALKKQQEEAALKAAEQKKAQEAKAADKAATSAKALPKCKVLKQQGTLPKMVIAFDGSQSMLINDVAGNGGLSSRLQAATSAASSLVGNIDKNVEIGLVEINGCPTAKSRGFFSGTQRQALRQTISNIDPMRYDGMTPLVDGLQQISRMTDGVNADALGILISDGEDTCPLTRNLDVCQVAKSIHKKKPKLKIHTILIGQDAGQAACIARITGGKVFSPQNAGEINADLQASGSEMKKVCED